MAAGCLAAVLAADINPGGIKPLQKTYEVPEGGVNLPEGFQHISKEELEDKTPKWDNDASGPRTWEQQSPIRATRWPIVPQPYYELHNATMARSAHKVCTHDEVWCTKQDRVVAILLCKGRKDPAALEFDTIRKRFHQGSLSFFVSWNQEVHDLYWDQTMGRNPTIVIMNPYDWDGTKRVGLPRTTVMPNDMRVYDYERVIEWIIRSTLAKVEQWPGDLGNTEGTIGRMVLHRSVSWPKAIIYTTLKDISEEVLETIEDRLPKFAVSVYRVTKMSDLGFEFGEARHPQLWEMLNDVHHENNVFISFKDPASGHKMKAASTVDRMPVVFDQFMIDARSKRPGGLKTKKQLKREQKAAKKARDKEMKMLDEALKRLKDRESLDEAEAEKAAMARKAAADAAAAAAAATNAAGDAGDEEIVEVDAEAEHTEL
jgi:hypothetical protein